MANGFKVNKQAIRKMSRAIEREFAKNPVRVPLHAEPGAAGLPPAATVNNYHGPVVTVNGDHSQIAWGNETLNQAQAHAEQIAPGYEDLADLITRLLANLHSFALDEGGVQEVQVNADVVLGEVVKQQPDQRIIKRALTMLKGLLAPVAAGLSKAATEESAEAARQMIDALGNAV